MGPLVRPQVFTRFMGIVALDTPQQNNPCQFYVGSPPATEMRNERILHNEQKTDNEDSNPRPYSQAAPASSHHNRNLPLNLGRVKNVMKGYCPPTLMGLPITLITHLFFVYKLTKLYDVTQVTSRRIESLDEILFAPKFFMTTSIHEHHLLNSPQPQFSCDRTPNVHRMNAKVYLYKSYQWQLFPLLVPLPSDFPGNL